MDISIIAMTMQVLCLYNDLAKAIIAVLING